MAKLRIARFDDVKPLLIVYKDFTCYEHNVFVTHSLQSIVDSEICMFDSFDYIFSINFVFTHKLILFVETVGIILICSNGGG